MNPLTIQDILNHFFERNPLVNREACPDGIELGEPGTAVHRIGTGWTACMPNLEAAAKAGCDLFISHEPAFCSYWDMQSNRDTSWGRKRIGFAEKAGMSMLAFHDCWDFFPEFGIRDSWIRFLGFDPKNFLLELPYGYPGTSRKTSKPWLTLHRTEPKSFRAYAREVKERIQSLIPQAIPFIMGDPDKVVQKVSMGVGCGIPTFEMQEAGSDVMILVFDRAMQTTIRQPLLDMGGCLIVIEHGWAEMPGMKRMAEYLNREFPGVDARYFGNEYPLQLI